MEGCHTRPMRSAASAYEFLVRSKATGCSDKRLLVVPGDPAHSYVIDKLVNRNLCTGVPMPKVLRGRPWEQLPRAQVQALYDWICEGAPNN